LITGLTFGLLPAFAASRADLNTALKESGNEPGGAFRHNKVRAVLVGQRGGPGALLLIGAALLFARSFAFERSTRLRRTSGRDD
jgi:hypothetical protein